MCICFLIHFISILPCHSTCARNPYLMTFISRLFSSRFPYTVPHLLLSSRTTWYFNLTSSSYLSVFPLCFFVFLCISAYSTFFCLVLFYFFLLLFLFYFHRFFFFTFFLFCLVSFFYSIFIFRGLFLSTAHPHLSVPAPLFPHVQSYLSPVFAFYLNRIISILPETLATCSLPSHVSPLFSLLPLSSLLYLVSNLTCFPITCLLVSI